jgi:hypothetical protein
VPVLFEHLADRRSNRASSNNDNFHTWVPPSAVLAAWMVQAIMLSRTPVGQRPGHLCAVESFDAARIIEQLHLHGRKVEFEASEIILQLRNPSRLKYRYYGTGPFGAAMRASLAAYCVRSAELGTSKW